METLAWLIIALFAVAGLAVAFDFVGGAGGCLVLLLVVVVPIMLLAWACSTIVSSQEPCYGYYSDTGEPCD